VRRVLTYWQLPSEEEAILARLEDLGRILAFPALRSPDRSEIQARPLRDWSEDQRVAGLLLTPEDDANRIQVEQKEFSGVAMWGVSAMDSCVVGYERGRVTGRELALSNLYAYLSRLEDGAVPKKHAEFLDWSKKVFAIVRRHAPETFKTYRATRAALKAQTEGEVELVDY
jgi:hypothetical protein